MARISLVEPRSASQEVQQIYEHRLRGKPANVHKAMAHNPQALIPFLAFYAATGRSLDRRLWELVYLRVSFLNHCSYCWQHHLASSTRAGLSLDDCRAMKGGDMSRYGGAERAALEYTEKLTREPGLITNADVHNLQEHFTDQQIVDLHLLVGLANLSNRFTGPLGLQLEFAPESI